MKIRVISAVVGLMLFVVILFFYDSYIFNIATSIVCMLAVYELIHSTKYIKDKFLTLLSLAFSGLVPFFNFNIFNGHSTLFISVFAFCLFLVLFSQKFKLEQIAIVFTVSLLVPYALSCLVVIRDAFENTEVSLYYVLMIFICAWVSDTGAYFTGRAFGKHKLAPTISPKKTIEGAIGGLIFCVICSIAFTYVYFEIVSDSGQNFTYSINLLMLVICTVSASIIGVFGDLTASIIKRQCSIKDFGAIMPGHGGIIDRFDSVLFIAPTFFSILQFDSVIVKII